MLQYGTLWSNRLTFNTPPSPSSPATPLSPSSSSQLSNEFLPSSPSSSSTNDIDRLTTKDPQHHSPTRPTQPLSSPPPIPPPSSPSLSDDPQQHQTLEKARKAGKYLQLLLHCQRCYGECNNPVMCKHAKLLYAHCSRCSFSSDKCPIAGCQQTKKLLQHYTLCRWERKNAKLCNGNPELKECLMCSFVEMNHQDHHSHHLQSPPSQSPPSQSRRQLEQQQRASPPQQHSSQHRLNLSLETIPHDHEFAIPLPPKRLRACHDHRHYLRNNQLDGEIDLNEEGEEDQDDEEEDENTSRLQQTRYRSVSHAPDHLGHSSRSTRTGSI